MDEQRNSASWIKEGGGERAEGETKNNEKGKQEKVEDGCRRWGMRKKRRG